VTFLFPDHITAGSLSVAGVSSGGAISAPYFSATSTSASSTFTNFNVTNSRPRTQPRTNLLLDFSRFTTGVIGSLSLSTLNGPSDARNGVVSARPRFGVCTGGTGATTLTGLLQGNGLLRSRHHRHRRTIPYFNGSNTLLATSTLFRSTAGKYRRGPHRQLPAYALDVNGAANISGILDFNYGHRINGKRCQLRHRERLIRVPKSVHAGSLALQSSMAATSASGR